MNDYNVVAKLSVDDSGFSSSMKNAAMSVSEFDSQAKTMSSSVGKMGAAFAVAQKAISVVGNAISSSLGGAISRVDTLRQFPKIMQQLGFSAEEAEGSTKKLAEGIDGLPTALDEITANTQSIALITGDLDKATETALALNNAFLASGSSTADAARGLTQYSQMLAKGQVDMQSWRTLQETMGAGLTEIANQFGYAGESAQNDLYQALKEGSITFDDFNSKLIECDAGVNGFAERAKTSTQGIGTSMQNLRTAVVKNVANMIENIDSSLSSGGFLTINQAIEKAKDGINSFFSFANKLVSNSIKSLKPVIRTTTRTVSKVGSMLGKVLVPALTAISNNMDIVAVAATGFVAKIVALKIISKIKSDIQSASKAIAEYKAAQDAAKIAVERETAAEGANVVASSASNAQLSAKTILLGVLSGELTIAQAAQMGFNAALSANPVGAAIMGITALIAVIKGITKAYEKFHPEIAEQREKQEALAQSYDDTVSSLKDYQSNLKKNASKHQEEKKEITDLASKVVELGEKKNRTAAETETLQKAVTDLNGKVSDLGVALDEETGKLNMSTDAIKARLKVMQSASDVSYYDEQLNNIREQQVEIDTELQAQEEALAEKRELAAAAEENLTNKHRGRYAVLNTMQQAEEEEVGRITELTNQKNSLAEQEKAYQLQRAEAAKNASQQIATAIEEETISFDMLSEANQEIIQDIQGQYTEFRDVATSIFDEIATQTDLSADQMLQTAQKNKDATVQWGNNMAQLRQMAEQWDGGAVLVQKFEAMGLDGAAELQVVMDEINNTGGTYGEQLATTLGESAESSKQAFIDGFGLEGMPEAITAMMTTTEQTMLDAAMSANWSEVGSNIVDGAAEGVSSNNALPEATTNKMDDTTNAAKDALESHSPSKVFEEIGKDIVEGAALGISDNKAAEKAVKTMTQNLVSGAKEAVQGMAKGLGSSKIALSGLSASTRTAMNAVRTSITTGMNAAKTAFTNGMNASKTVVVSSMNNIRSVVHTGMNNTRNIISTTMNAVRTSISNGFRSVSSIASGQLRGMNSVISSEMNAALSTTQRYISNINSQFSRSMYSTAYNYGSWIGQGLYNGMNAWLSSIQRIAAQYVSKANEVIAAKAKIGSPSKLFRKMGSFIGEGFALGIEDEISLVEKMAAKIEAAAEKIELPDFSSFNSFDGGKIEFATNMGTYSAELFGFEGLAEDLSEILSNRPLVVYSELEVDSRTVAKATTPAIQTEKENIDRIDNYRKGIK